MKRCVDSAAPQRDISKKKKKKAKNDIIKYTENIAKERALDTFSQEHIDFYQRKLDQSQDGIPPLDTDIDTQPKRQEPELKKL
ncbi:hypothetical protein PG984_009741 [Apiospora sp. TS-2023a]